MTGAEGAPGREERLRRELVRVGRRAARKGYVVAGEGNFSARLDRATVLVTPAGREKGSLRPVDMVAVDLAGRPRGDGRPSSEVRLHLALYRSNPRVWAVVHTHAPWATVLAAAGQAVRTDLLAEAAAFLGEVPVVSYATPGTEELGRAAAPLAQDHRALLLANHGTLTWGGDVEEAFRLLEILERAAFVHFATALLGRRAPIPSAALARLAARPTGPGAPGRAG